jgi:hypothetical protein
MVGIDQRLISIIDVGRYSRNDGFLRLMSKETTRPSLSSKNSLRTARRRRKIRASAEKCDELYSPRDEIVVRWSDPAIGIKWGVEHPSLSARDMAAPLLAEVNNLRVYGQI